MEEIGPIMEPASVYRMYDQTGELIYVGLTSRGHVRQIEHMARKGWAGEVSETHWEHFDTRPEAAARERHLIETQHPRHNVVHRQPDGEPERMEFRLVAEQYDILQRTHREIIKLEAELRNFTKDFAERFDVLQRMQRMVFYAFKHGHVVAAHDINAANKYLRYLDTLDKDRPLGRAA